MNIDLDHSFPSYGLRDDEKAMELKLRMKSKEFDFKLISGVKQRPNLYDKCNLNFGHSYLRQAAWNEIASDLQCTVPFAKSRWFKLRERFLREKKTLDNNDTKPKWHLFKAMCFLAPHIETDECSSSRDNSPPEQLDSLDSQNTSIMDNIENKETNEMEEPVHLNLDSNDDFNNKTCINGEAHQLSDTGDQNCDQNKEEKEEVKVWIIHEEDNTSEVSKLNTTDRQHEVKPIDCSTSNALQVIPTSPTVSQPTPKTDSAAHSKQFIFKIPLAKPVSKAVSKKIAEIPIKHANRMPIEITGEPIEHLNAQNNLNAQKDSLHNRPSTSKGKVRRLVGAPSQNKKKNVMVKVNKMGKNLPALKNKLNIPERQHEVGTSESSRMVLALPMKNAPRTNSSARSKQVHAKNLPTKPLRSSSATNIPHTFPFIIVQPGSDISETLNKKRKGSVPPTAGPQAKIVAKSPPEKRATHLEAISQVLKNSGNQSSSQLPIFHLVEGSEDINENSLSNSQTQQPRVRANESTFKEHRFGLVMAQELETLSLSSRFYAKNAIMSLIFAIKCI